MVTGVPIRHRNHRATAHTLRWAQTAPGVRLEEGLLIDPAWIEEYCEAYDWQPAKTQNIDRRVTLNGVSAYIGAYHGQFVIPKAAALKVLPLPTHNPLATEELDEVLDAAGYLRLSTTNVHVHHMGNVLAPRWEAEAGRLGVGIQPGLGRRLRPIPNWRYRAVHNRIVRPIVSQMHDRLFEMLNQKAR